MTPGQEIQAAFDSGSKFVTIPAGIYEMSSPWKVNPGCRIYCEPRCQFNWNYASKQNAIEFSGNNELIAYGCHFQMNWFSADPKPTNDSDDGLLFITSVKYVTIRGGTYHGALIDGIFIRNSNGITIDGVLVSASSRNGISIVSGRSITVSNSIFQGTRRLSPQAGICVEPNDISDPIEKITFENCQCIDNASHDYLFNFSKFTNKSMKPDITLKNSHGRLDIVGMTGIVRVL